MLKSYFTILKTKHNLTIVLLGVAAFLPVIVFAASARPETQEPESGVIEFEFDKEKLPPDSPFLDSRARVNENAATIEKKDNGRENYDLLLAQKKKNCFSLPQNFWVVILAAYVFLIIFNLTWKFEEARRPRWFWEIFYTLLALLAWHNYDQCRQNNWFAQSVILQGLIIYFFYFYYYNHRASLPATCKKEDDKTEPLPFK